MHLDEEPQSTTAGSSKNSVHDTHEGEERPDSGKTISEVSVADTLESNLGLRSDTDDIPPQVLVVDDESHILKAVQRLLINHECELLTAEDGEEACEVLREQPIAVVISDQRMPGMSGLEVLDYARRHFPKTVRVMLTGNSNAATAIDAINKGEVFRFIAKPWDHDQFVRIVDMAIEQHELQIAKERYEEQIEDQNDQLRRLNDELEQRVEERTREMRRSKIEVDRLYQELRESFDGVIKALLSIMELGDIQVVEHCQRTAERVRMFGEHLELDDDAVRELERAALLHWIGLINAPSTLFEKPIEQFDTVENATWEFHPLLGQQAIRHVSALNRAGRVILHYLYRYDDPEFQPGESPADQEEEPMDEEFLRLCQILAICSFFEQVRTARQNDGDVDQDFIEEGLRVIDEGAGGRFDPELVEEFRELVGGECSEANDTELVVAFDDLEPGMVLARPLETAQGIPVAPRDMIITDELIERLERFRDSKGLGDIHVWG